uniref:Uncharacterized protein n=1 Tax=Peronospora matthiolae TaxID=2874970 RepID=A0AAV1V8K2_9STRA
MAAGFLSAAAAASAGRDCFSVGFAARIETSTVLLVAVF